MKEKLNVVVKLTDAHVQLNTKRTWTRSGSLRPVKVDWSMLFFPCEQFEGPRFSHLVLFHFRSVARACKCGQHEGDCYIIMAMNNSLLPASIVTYIGRKRESNNQFSLALSSSSNSKYIYIFSLIVTYLRWTTNEARRQFFYSATLASAAK